MNKKTFNRLKDTQKALAIQFFIEQIGNGSIAPDQKDSFSMGFEAGLGFALNLVSDFLKDEDGNVQNPK